MKKQLLTMLACASMGFAHQVTANITDEYSYIPYQAGLHFHIDNPEKQTRKVRMAYLFFAEEGQKFIIDRTLGCVDKNIKGIDNAIINLNDTGKGRYVLDVMLDMPQGSKDFCILLRKNNFGNFKVDRDFIVNWDMGVDGESLHYTYTKSPLDHDLTYNYVAKPRAVDHQLKKNERFVAKTMYDEKTEGLTEAERFRSYSGATFRDVPAKALVDLNVESYGAYKDTRMLMTSFGSLIDQFHWNESTLDGHYQFYTGVEEREIFIGRCWGIAVFNMYSYFFGNRNTIENAMTQDEMIYKAKVVLDGGDPKTGVFIPSTSEGENNIVSAKLINEIMYGANAVDHDKSKEPLSGEKIYNLIRGNDIQKGKPLFISANTPGGPHVMLIDGLALTVDGKNDTLVHLVNLDNFGSESYVYWDALKKILSGYVTYDTPTGFATTDALHPVDLDSDGDGVVDFDEYYRFKTNENKYSTADDGVSDYDKIYAETVSMVMDFDDPGWVRQGFPVGDPQDIPDDVTLYALDYLSVNDNVACFDSPNENLTKKDNISFGCKVASEGTRKINTVNEGSRAFVKAIYSKGGVLIRDKAQVGNVAMFVSDRDYYGVTIQGNAADYQKRIFYPNPATWPFKVKKNVESIDGMIGYQQKIVKNGETFTISGEEGHNNFGFLKVEGGGKLVIGTGEIYVGNIQLESGSTFMFEHPSYETVLHLNGNVIWRGKYVENESVEVRFQSMSNAVARGFKLIQHSNNEMDISSVWHGTIIAPYSKVVLGQPSGAKKIFGQVLAKEVVVHQNSFVYHVAYSPNDPARLLAKKRGEEIKVEKPVASPVASNVKIMNVSRDEIGFAVTKPGRYNVSVMKTNGSVVASFAVDRSMPGAESVRWSAEGIPNGTYILAIKHEGKVSSKLFVLK